MATKLKLFSAAGAENFAKLEREINEWLAAEDGHIQPVNSQTATCALPDGDGSKQAVVISLWYLDPPMHHEGH
jgi:hypothetical protein